ncbi:MICOS complex subunit MIC19 [Athalia rosae]|uniref:MICOS complex subunit MIC19 n=1 Tax=Athalia rosae TaxID=37344 RepID=UPI000626C5E8|nr:MICOS complex subunit MIC19 [Athalia rosae]XP_025602202.1 MICOS complex subunit MIC19 [Athalia rosae]
MGSNQSARKLTISNEEEVRVIKVSKAVVQRLQGAEDENGEKKTTKSAEPPYAMPLPHLVSQRVPVVPDGSANAVPVYYYPEYTVSALEIQQQKEEELKNQEHYWQRRLENMERTHKNINNIVEAEYKKAINEFTNGGKVPIPSTRSPCDKHNSKVLKCYQNNPKEVLQCSALVEEFSNCVDQHRANMIAARC